jgi:HAD superfamily hydrolase (TIGR01509 family)
MIKCIIFDLDGVLVSSKKIHFKVLNKALLRFSKTKFQISYSDHIKIFDGLSTKDKLAILFKNKKITKNEIKKISNFKQELTKEELKTNIKYNTNLYNLFKVLSKKYILAIATNSINETLDICIKKLKINKFIKFKIGTDILKNKKPHPEIYLRCLIALGVRPSETLILEDSYIGRQSAKDSGCFLMPIKSINDVKINKIYKHINLVEKNLEKKNNISFWEDTEMNILIPMAGLGSRFEKAGFTFPKPLIEIHGKPMIQWVIDSLKINAKFIFIVQSQHQQKFNIKSLLKYLYPNSKIIETNGLTEGAACTSLLATEFIDNNNPLLIANSDQYIEWDSAKTFYKLSERNVDGAILTFKSTHPKWSYAKINENNEVEKVAEKEVISNNATVGVYYWKRGKDYVRFANDMIKKNIRTNNEFYICPVYNEAIKNNKKIITEEVKAMWGLGTPEDLNYFLKYYKFSSQKI